MVRGDEYSIHLEAENIYLHMMVDDCYVYNDDVVKISIYGFINIRIFINYIKYLSVFDNENSRILLIKNGEIIEEVY